MPAGIPPSASNGLEGKRASTISLPEAMPGQWVTQSGVVQDAQLANPCVMAMLTLVRTEPRARAAAQVDHCSWSWSSSSPPPLPSLLLFPSAGCAALARRT